MKINVTSHGQLGHSLTKDMNDLSLKLPVLSKFQLRKVREPYHSGYVILCHDKMDIEIFLNESVHFTGRYIPLQDGSRVFFIII